MLVKVFEYLSSYEKLLVEIDKLLKEDRYVDIIGLMSEIDHLIPLIEEEIKSLDDDVKTQIRERAKNIVDKQEEILSAIESKIQLVKKRIDVLPKIHKAAKAYGKNQNI